MLTSAQAIALMEEKIRKKNEEMEAKEARKKEREEKKRIREEEATKKAVEKQQKAEERKRKAAEKQEEVRRKAEGKYEDDVVDDELQNEWICCSNCDKWMHLDCVIMEGNSYVCVLCNLVLK